MKIIIRLAVLLSVIFYPLYFANAIEFSDVRSSHYAYNSIIKVIENDIMYAYDDMSFQGNKKVTRYELAVTLVKLIEKFEPAILTPQTEIKQNCCQEIPSGHWAKTAVYEMVNCGLMTGFPDKTFQGKRFVSRYEFAACCCNLLKKLESFNIKPKRVCEYVAPEDLPSDLWAGDGCYRNIIETGLIKLYPDKTFRGKTNLIRYDLAVVMAKFIDIMKDSSSSN